MAFTLIFIGLLFTLNPMLGLVDFLPDFIGLILVYLGTERLCSVSPELEDAAKYVKWAIFLSIGRTLTSFGSSAFDETMTLGIAVILAALETGFYALTLIALSNGFSYLNVRYCGENPDGKTELESNNLQYGKTVTETPEFKVIGIAFFAVRSVFSVLPLLSALSIGEDENGEIITGAASEWLHYSTMLTLLNLLVTFAVALIWFFAVKGYILGMKRDSALCHAVFSAYSEKRLNDPGYFIRRRLSAAFSFLSLSGIFLIDFIGDGVNYLPDIGFALFGAVSVFLISKYCAGTPCVKWSAETRGWTQSYEGISPAVKRAYICGGVYAATALASFIYANFFASRRYFLSFTTMISSYPAEYMLTILLALAEGVALVFFVHSLISPLSEITDGHVGLEVDDVFVRIREENEKSKQAIKKKLKALFIISYFIAASGVAFAVTLHLFPEYWMIHMAMNIAFFIFVLNISSRFKAEIKARYEKPGE